MRLICNGSSISLDIEDYDRPVPSLRIAEHATRDDSDESVERGGPRNLPSECIELVVVSIVPPERLRDPVLQIALDARLAQSYVIRKAHEERKIRRGMRRHAWQQVLL